MAIAVGMHDGLRVVIILGGILLLAQKEEGHGMYYYNDDENSNFNPRIYPLLNPKLVLGQSGLQSSDLYAGKCSARLKQPRPTALEWKRNKPVLRTEVDFDLVWTMSSLRKVTNRRIS
jgi:hypothetical protein